MIHCEVHSDQEPFVLDSTLFELGQKSSMKIDNRANDNSPHNIISSTSFSESESQMIVAATTVDDIY